MLRRSSHAVYECRYHLVWATWHSRKALTQSHRREYCEEVLRRAADEYGMNIEVQEVDADHVHLCIEITPQMSVGRATGILKSVSAREMLAQYSGLKQIFWSEKKWGASYFVRTVGEGVTAEMVKRYIQMHEDRAEFGSIQAKLPLKAKPKGCT